MNCYQHIGGVPEALKTGAKTGAATFAVAFVLLLLMTAGGATR